MPPVPVQSTPTSPDSFERAGGKDTNTQTGGSKASPLTKHNSTVMPSPTLLKLGGESGSSSTSNVRLSDEAEQRKDELDGYLEAVHQKKRKRTNLPVPNETHVKCRGPVDKGDKWEHDLERLHGLAEEEVTMVIGIALKRLKEEKFPDFDADATRGISFYRRLAKPGWESMKETQEMIKKYLKECGEQICRGGVWRMIAN